MTSYLSTAWRLSAISLALITTGANASPTVSRLTPPSELFSSGNEGPVIARFLPGHRFDLQATGRWHRGH